MHLLAAIALLSKMHGAVLLLVDYSFGLPLVQDVGGFVVVGELGLGCFKPSLQLSDLFELAILALLAKPLV